MSGRTMFHSIATRWIAVVTALVTAGILAGLTAPPSTAATTPMMVPVTPTRILDTRTTSTPNAGSTTVLTVAGRNGVPADVSAVILNVAAVSPSSAGWVTVWPSGTNQPTASNLNYAPGQTIANQVITKVGSNGQISLFTAASTNLLVDITGYYPRGAAYGAITPLRLLDTRTSSRPGAGSVTSVRVTGTHGVPANGVAAVVLNVTAVLPVSSGWVTVWPTGVAKPNASNVNYVAGQTVAGLVIAKVGSGGQVSLYTSAAANLLVDIAGWIPATSDYTGLTPTRVLDTRSAHAVVPAGGSVSLRVTDRGGVPAVGVGAVEVNVTAVSPARAGWITAYPAGSAKPVASTVNYQAGHTVANSGTLKVGANGQITLFSSARTNLIVDIIGYWKRPVSPIVVTAGGLLAIDGSTMPTTSYSAFSAWLTSHRMTPTSVSSPTGFCFGFLPSGARLIHIGKLAILWSPGLSGVAGPPIELTYPGNFGALMVPADNYTSGSATPVVALPNGATVGMTIGQIAQRVPITYVTYPGGTTQAYLANGAGQPVVALGYSGTATSSTVVSSFNTIGYCD